jgi:hypothetical protein
MVGCHRDTLFANGMVMVFLSMVWCHCDILSVSVMVS